MNRYIVTNKGMMKGYWKIYDTLTGKVNDSGLASKRGAQAIADTYNARDYGIWEQDGRPSLEYLLDPERKDWRP